MFPITDELNLFLVCRCCLIFLIVVKTSNQVPTDWYDFLFVLTFSETCT